MRKQALISLMFASICLFVLVAVFLVLNPDPALATYDNLDVQKAFNAKQGADGGSTSPIYSTLVDILRAVTNGILLPAGIVFFVWRTVYLAIFPLMLEMDPLQMTGSPRYSGKGSYSHDRTKSAAENGIRASINKMTGGGAVAGEDVQDKPIEGGGGNTIKGYSSFTGNVGALRKTGEKCLKIELKMMFKGILIVGLLWTIIQLVITGVGFFIQMAQVF